jgi:hypothetical protein
MSAADRQVQYGAHRPRPNVPSARTRISRRRYIAFCAVCASLLLVAGSVIAALPPHGEERAQPCCYDGNVGGGDVADADQQDRGG